MNPLVRRFIKTAIGFLVLGLLLGAWMLLQREWYGVWPPAYLVSAHRHVIFVGFVLFMILGVAHWLFPKARPGDRRFHPLRMEMVYWLLLSGTLLRFVGELLRAYTDLSVPEGRLTGGLILLAGLAQVVALLLYVWIMWHRIRPSARSLREGEENHNA